MTSTKSPLGVVENFNNFFGAVLTMIIMQPERRSKWNEYLAPVSYCWRCSTINGSYSPFKMLFGVSPPNPIDLLLEIDQETKENHTSKFKKELVEVYQDVRRIQQRSTILQTMYKNVGQRNVQYQPEDIVLVSYVHKKLKGKPSYKMARIIKHHPNSSTASVLIKKHGKWEMDSVKIGNLSPYIPYSAQDFTTAPNKRGVAEQPPVISQTDTTKLKTNLWDDIATKSGMECRVGDFVIIPADAWDDIKRDGLVYSVAQCVRIYQEIANWCGEFQRYGNYSGKLGFNRTQLPGYIDSKDHKYVYAKNSQKKKYTNLLVDLGIPNKIIHLKSLTLAFTKLTKSNAVPQRVQEEINKLFPLTSAKLD